MAKAAVATRTMGMAPHVGLIRLNDLPDGDGFHRSWVMVLPEGVFDHPDFGKLDFTRSVLHETIRNFEKRVRGIDVALDYDHKANKGESAAPGWIEQLQYRPAQDDVPAGLWARVRWTELGLHDVKSQIYRYLSAEFRDTYTDNITGNRFNNVLTGLTLTNRPFMKQMPAIMLSKFERPGHYTDKDRKKIAAADFAGPGRTFPIVTQQDVHDAARLIGHAANPAAVKARIKAIAKRKGFSLPKEWQDQNSDSAGDGESGGGMGMADLNDMSLYEDEAESARYELADTKKATGKAKGKIINKNKPDDDNEDDEGMEYDDGEDDAAEMDDGDSDADEYAEEDADSGDDDIDHLPARQKNAARVKVGSKGGSKQMSESGAYAGLTFDEMAHRLAEMERKVYLSEAEVILKGFEAGSFQFSATEARTISKRNGAPLDGKTIMRSGNYKLAPKALKAVRAWLTSDAAYTLSESSRREVLGVFETIAAGVVDLSVRGSSHDMERQKTVVAKSPTYQAASKPAERDLLLTETAGEIAAERGKDLDTLRQVQRQPSREGIEAAQELQRIYALAERRVTAGITAAE